MNNHSRGATLIEVMISVFILAIAFIPILRLVTFGSVSTAKISYYAKAAALAQQLIEECKHVPFKVYQKEYNDLAEGEKFEVHPDFYKETSKSIEEFLNTNKEFIKNYECEAYLKPKKNELNQITELWFEVVILWREKGDMNSGFPLRKVKCGSAYYNSEAI